MDTEKRLARPMIVTGATGFIGRRVVVKLLEKGIRVRALVLPGEPIPEAWADRVDVVRGSIDDTNAVEEAVCDTGTVIHLAAVVSDWGDEQKFWTLTVDGSRLVFEQALKNEARIVLASSIVVYGDNIQRNLCDEQTGYGKTFGPYSRTKQAQEKLAWEYHRDKGMDLVVVRPANVYGPGSGPWLHDVVAILKSGSPGLISGGRMNAGLAYVDNVADILILAAVTDGATGKAFNASDGLDITWRQYFSDIAAMIGAKTPGSIPRPVAAGAARAFEWIWKGLNMTKRPPITREALNLVGSDNRISIDRVRDELGYESGVSYAEGLALTKAYVDRKGLAHGGQG